MKTFTALTLVLFATAAFGLAAQPAPKTLRATGRVITITQDSITIRPGNRDLTLTVDKTTKVIGKGVGTTVRNMKSEGRPAAVTDLVHPFDSVTVKYTETAGTLQAAEINIKVKALARQ